MSRVALPDPDPDWSKSWDSQPDLDLRPTQPNPIFVGILSPLRYLAHSCWGLLDHEDFILPGSIPAHHS